MKEQIKKDILETVKVIDTSELQFVDIREHEHLVSELHQKINPDYPNTTPEGGTGFGKVLEITIE